MPIMNKLYGYFAVFLLVAASLLLCAGTARAVTYNLETGVVPVTMPDGKVVTMWGFGLAGGAITVPGPVLDVPNGETLTINLTNNLTVPVSIVSPSLGLGAAPTPVMEGGRVRSFTAEAAAGGGAQSFTFTTRPGTFLYESGTDPSLQVPMGLYGAIRVAAATPGQAYDSAATAFDTDNLVLFSEVDSTLNDAVEADTFGTTDYPSTVNFQPDYFLINGQGYAADSVVPFYAGASGDTALIRLLNAGSMTRMPMLQGSYVTEVAKDGYLMNHPIDRLSVMLEAGKTKDVLVTLGADGMYPLYDRRNYLTNGGQYPGGALSFFTVGVSALPYNLSVSAANGTEGVAQQVTGTWGHPGGADQIRQVFLQVGSVATGGIFKMQYNAATNLLYIANDANNGWIGGFAPGSANTITNARGTLDCQNTTVTLNGNIIEVSFNVTPAVGFFGSKWLSLYAYDVAFNPPANGWERLGAWLIAEASPSIPTGVSVVAADGAPNVAQQIIATWLDASGSADIKFAYMQIGSVGTGGVAKLYYNNQTNLLYVMNDLNNTWLGGFAPGSANVIANSFVSLNCATTTVTPSGNNLEVSFNVTPLTGYAGTKPMRLYAVDYAGNHPASWLDYAYWNIVVPNNAPANVSITAADGNTGVPQQVTAVWSDADGSSDIRYAYMQIGTVGTGGPTKVYYDNVNNLLYLLNDAGNAWTGGFAPGSANVIANSLMSLDCATTTVTPAGNNLTVSFNLTPQAGYTGIKPMRLFVYDLSWVSSGSWDTLANWTIN